MAAAVQNNELLDFIVVGGGCIGASIALALPQKWPEARIVWLEGTHVKTASKDINKIIRTPYPDKDYVALAEEALKMWETQTPYCTHFHKTSWVQAVGVNSHRSTMLMPEDRVVSIETVVDMVGSRDKPRLDPGEELWLNRNIGYVDSALALEAVAEEAAKLGVVRKKENVTKLIVNGGSCKGVESMDDVTYTARNIIVATGPWTPGLLEDSKVGFPEDFFNVVAVGAAILALDQAEFEALKSMPILVTETGDVIPSEKGGILKISTTSTFNITHPDELDNDLGNVDIGPNRDVLFKMLPQFTGRKLESWSCPDLMTPKQHPIMAQAPETAGLYIAAGGSFHGFKFLPLWGSFMVALLSGKTDLETQEGRLLQKWSWDRSDEFVAIHKDVTPKAGQVR